MRKDLLAGHSNSQQRVISRQTLHVAARLNLMEKFMQITEFLRPNQTAKLAGG